MEKHHLLMQSGAANVTCNVTRQKPKIRKDSDKLGWPTHLVITATFTAARGAQIPDEVSFANSEIQYEYNTHDLWGKVTLHRTSTGKLILSASLMVEETELDNMHFIGSLVDSALYRAMPWIFHLIQYTQTSH